MQVPEQRKQSEPKSASPRDVDRRLLSVGHSIHEIDAFLKLLGEAGITAVADVRSHPSSQRLPQYNGPELKQKLLEHGVAYVFLGDLLGGRPDRPSLYDAEGRVDYWRVRATPEFQQGLDRLSSGLEQHTVAMLCSEEDPLECHRGLMIAPALAERGVPTWHLRGDGRVESPAQIEARLLAETKVGGGILHGLFAASVTAEERRQLLDEAYRRQAQRKAFRLRPDDSNEAGSHDEF